MFHRDKVDLKQAKNPNKGKKFQQKKGEKPVLGCFNKLIFF